MKIKNKLLMGIFCLLMVAFCIVGLVACDSSSGGSSKGNKCSHEWGEWVTTKEATCLEDGEEERECEECGKIQTSDIPAGAHVPEADDGDCTTPVMCSLCGEIAVYANENHVGGTATCVSRASCSICGTEYGELSGHSPNTDDGDCTTAVYCSICGDLAIAGNDSHTGGEATCVERAKCSVCGTEYGELAAHEESFSFVKRLDYHYSVYACCNTRASDNEPHSMANGACTVCGFKPTVNGTAALAAPGDTSVKVAISITDNPGITGLMVNLKFDTAALILTDAESGEALEMLDFTLPSKLESGCTFLWDGLKIEDEDMKNGEFLILTFDVSSNALPGEYSLMMKISAYDNDLKPFDLIIEGVKIVVKNN